LETLPPSAARQLAGERRRVRRLLWLALYAVATLAMLIYLGGGVVAGARLAAIVIGVLFPCAALFSNIGAIQRLPQAARAVTAISLAILSITPAFYLRRALPLPGWLADVAFVLLLCSCAQYRSAYRRFLDDLGNPLFRASAPFLFLALPILFILTWMGYEVHEGAQVVYYGLFPIDFANLTSTVSLINASHGLPHWSVVDLGVLNYHWLFFCLPAWVSSFGGGHTPNANALVLCNYVSACVLFLVIGAVTDCLLRAIEPDRRLDPSLVAAAAGVITLASLAMYPYQALVSLAVRLTHMQSLAIAARNGLLLSLPNSMTAFGNNTMAVAMALLVVMMLLEWNRRLEKGHIVIGGIFLAMIPGYSITLLFPVALTLGIWLLLGRVRRWPLALIYAGIAGAAILAVMAFGLHLFGSGGSGRGLAVAFDRGQYLRHVVFAFLPIWGLAWMGRGLWRRLPLFWAVILCGVVVPSLLYIPNTLTGHIDFSMKIATLIAVAAAPFAYAGLEQCRRNWRSPAALLATALVALGLACTVAYSGQFAVARFRHDRDRALVLSADYLSALKFIRDNTAPDAVVIDPQSAPLRLSTPTVFIAERLVYLPTRYEEETVKRYPDIVQRGRDFEQWSNGGFADRALSARFASAADCLLIRGPEPANDNWKLMQRFGEFSVLQSRIRYSFEKPAAATIAQAWPNGTP
jgi:hypothetical protein